MKTFNALVKRNVKLFFNDKGMFFTSLITPAILLVLYATFLGKVYRESFTMNLPQGFKVSDKIIDGLVGGQLISSILAVSCVTVAFCSNLLMVQDKVNGSIRDLKITPVRPYLLSIGYYLSSVISTLIICFTAMTVCLSYLAVAGWYMTTADICLLALDIFLLVLFGTAISSIINFYLSTQGQISAVGTIVSSGYGFISGAYMPISQFSEGLQKLIHFFPGTYGTSLLRNHALRGSFEALQKAGFPADVVESIKDSIDCNIYFFGNKVPEFSKFLIISASVSILLAVYIMVNFLKKRSV